MLKTGTYLLTFLTLLTGTAAIAEDEAPQAAKYMGLKRAVRFDVSPPLRDIPPVPLTSQPGNLVEPEPPPSPMGPQDADPVLQTIVGPPDIPGTSVSFTGFRSQGATPPDPVGAVGPNHYVAMANTRFAVYDKSGTLLMGPSTIKTLWSGFGGNCETRNDGDPIILYDQLADRWLLTQFTTRSPYYNCVALSTSGDPTGSYYRWEVDVPAPRSPRRPPCPNAWPCSRTRLMICATRRGCPAISWSGSDESAQISRMVFRVTRSQKARYTLPVALVNNGKSVPRV